MRSVRKFKSRFAGTFIIFIIILISCSSRSPSVSGDEKEAFISTYVELTLIQTKFSSRQKMYERADEIIYTRNATSKEFMQEFTQKIESNLKLQTEIYQTISERLKKYQELPIDSLNKIIKSLSVSEERK